MIIYIDMIIIYIYDYIYDYIYIWLCMTIYDDNYIYKKANALVPPTAH